MPVIIVGVFGLAIGYLLLKSQTPPTQSGDTTQRTYGPNSQTSQRYEAPGTDPNSALIGIGLAGTGINLASQFAALNNQSNDDGSSGGGKLSTGLEVAGILAGVAGAIVGVFTRHHAEAVKKEAAGLNAAVPHFYQGLSLVMQAFSNREVNAPQAKKMIDQVVADYYLMVKGIINSQPSSVKLSLWPGITDRGLDHYYKPAAINPCNGPCSVAANWLIPDSYLSKDAIDLAVKGKHGQLHFGPIPAHAGFNGIGNVTVPF